MTETDALLSNNQAYVENFSGGGLPTSPSRRVTVLACMDSRLDLFGALGLGEGEVHMIRNAGGLVTEDAIRSLTISQHLLGTREIVLIHHTDCGLSKLDEGAAIDTIEATAGTRPDFALGAFADVDESVRASIAAVRSSPYLLDTEHVRGFVYDVDTGRLREVT